MFDMNEANYRIAFSFQGKEDLKLKNDERYVKILALQRSKIDGKKIEKSLSFHKCNAEDFKEFYPIEKGSKILFDEIEKDEDRGFFCLDWENNDFLLFGDEDV